MRAVLFDFDYTLADSSDAIVECFGAGLSAVGLPAVPAERIRRTIGLPLPEALWALHGVADATLAARFREGFHTLAERIMHERTRVFEPVAGVIAALRASGLATAICSTKRRGQIERILARHALLDGFDAIVGGEDVTRHKPAPDALLLALAQLGVAPEGALYVGDHRVDADAAAHAQVPFVAVLSGPSPPEDFAGRPVRAFLGSVAELPALLATSPAARGGQRA
ncbi:MAG: HAD family hydrolase [Deltaproteobacteria bacterium]|nr:HAD family hydrolase [Deltaproteobacteria bacterium]